MKKYPCRLYADPDRKRFLGEREVKADSPLDAAVEAVQQHDAGDHAIAKGGAAWVEVDDGGACLFVVRGVPQPMYEAESLGRVAAPGGGAP